MGKNEYGMLLDSLKKFGFYVIQANSSTDSIQFLKACGTLTIQTKTRALSSM